MLSLTAMPPPTPSLLGCHHTTRAMSPMRKMMCQPRSMRVQAGGAQQEDPSSSPGPPSPINVQQQLSGFEESSISLIRAACRGDIEPEDAAHQLARASKAHALQLAQQDGRQRSPSPSDGSDIMDVIQQPTGVPEVVFGTGKSPDQLAASLEAIATRQRVVLATRVEPTMYAAVRKLVQGVEYNARARLLVYRSPIADELPKIERLPGTVAVVSGGAADQPVAEECRLVAEHLGCFAFKMEGFVVSSLHRLLSSLEALRAADVVVVVSGLDGIAPIVAGLVDSPVIAVPTSAGYGASIGGVTSLLSQLSCSVPGISICNIDNGFGGAVCAYKTLRMANKLHRIRSKGEIELALAEKEEQTAQ